MEAKTTSRESEIFRITRAERTGIILFLLFFALIWCMPFYSLIKDSLKVNGFQNYMYVLTNQVNGVSFYQYFFNSGINAIGSSSLLVFICVTAGFSFSKIHFAGRRFVFSITVMCLAVAGPVLIVPFFYILKTLGLYNSHMGIIICEAVITVPFGILMVKNFFDGMPDALMEAANIEGANLFQSFRLIYLPLARPAIINLFVLQFMWSLQDFLFPLMFLTKERLYTTTVAVSSFQGAYGMSPQNLGRYNAALVLISIPSIALFILAQRYIINGITAGAVKE